MKYLLDANVYLSAIRSAPYYAAFRHVLGQIMPNTWLSSVVLQELLRGARGDLGRAAVRRVTRALERAERVVAPIHADWVQAGMAQGRIWDEEPSRRSKVLQNDILIACSARRIGAVVVTENVGDFSLIARHVPHTSMRLRDLARHLGA